MHHFVDFARYQNCTGYAGGARCARGSGCAGCVPWSKVHEHQPASVAASVSPAPDADMTNLIPHYVAVACSAASAAPDVASAGRKNSISILLAAASDAERHQIIIELAA